MIESRGKGGMLAHALIVRMVIKTEDCKFEFVVLFIFYSSIDWLGFDSTVQGGGKISLELFVQYCHSRHFSEVSANWVSASGITGYS